MKHLYTLLLLIIALASVRAQDPHFSDYGAFTQQYNPALTGQVRGYSSRVQLGYRDQWRSVLGSGSFSSVYAAFEQQFCAPFEGDFWSYGIQLLGDSRGDFPLQRADAMGSLAYMKRLSAGRDLQLYIGLGLEGGAIHHRLDRDGFLFDEQFDDPSSPGEELDHYQFTFWDYGVGFSTYLASKKRTNFGVTIGGAIKHLGEPAYRYFDSETGFEPQLKRRYVAHLGLVLPMVKDRMGLSLKSRWFFQQPYVQHYHSISFLFEESVTIGAGWRQVRAPDNYLADAVVVSASIMVGPFALSASYDANISPLQPASASFGALELGLSYSFGSERCSIVYCSGL